MAFSSISRLEDCKMANIWSKKFLFAVICLFLTQAIRCPADEIVPPLPGRFAPADVKESPDFRRHVLPVMSRMGCNAAACHGSFQGQGGFRLSLFGYDFKSDHDALTAGDHPRVNLSQPAASLILNKPTSADDHGGGLRFPKGSWQYNVFRRWVEDGAKGVAPDEARFARLKVTPSEITFTRPGETVQLRAVATWSDGTSEDVTAISRFRSNDEAIATVNETGLVSARSPGDTHVVAFYDNGVAPIPVMLPVSDQVGPRYPQVAAPTVYDRMIVDKLRKLGEVPSPPCTDAEFLRRVSLDVTGTLPSPAEIDKFLADKSPNKRARKIDELLETPAYAAWWTTRLCDLTGDDVQQQGSQFFKQQQARQWYEWIYRRVHENVPYDQIVAGLVLATGREKPCESYTDYCREMGSYMRQKNPADFTARKTMPYYMSRQNVRKPEEKALSFSYALLGVRLECSQCHKHPFDQWTQQDFRQFQAFFQPVDNGVQPPSGPEARQMRQDLGLDRMNNMNRQEIIQKIRGRIENDQPFPFTELYVARQAVPQARIDAKIKNNPNFAAKLQKRGAAGTKPTVTPKLLGGTEVSLADCPDPRVKLMEWLRRKDNPYFARAWVNRVWAGYFGIGIVDPPDDMSLANAPSNRPLLDALAEGFVSHGYDMKWVHRTILNTAAYQRSWRTNATNRLDNHNFSHALVRRLPAEVVNDVLRQATANRQQADAMVQEIETRAIGPAPNAGDRYLLVAFGRPERVVTCDCARSNDASLVQTIFLLNDAALRGRIENGGWVQQLRKQQAGSREQEARRTEPPRGYAAGNRNGPPPPTPRSVLPARRFSPDPLIREVFLRTVSRPPREDEWKEARNVVASANGTVDGIRTLLWTMLNTKEFIVNH
jgi:hypothetical protein